MTLRQLQRVAQERGVQTCYINGAGEKITASSEILETLVEIVGPPPDCKPVIVQWDGKPKRVPHRGIAELQWEDGERLPVKNAMLPASPPGYHKMEVNDREFLVISAPSKSYSDPHVGHAWGVFAPMYALRGRTEGFAAWRELVNWAHPLGASVMATLPLLASFEGEPSPYSPASRLFWNEFYVGADVPPNDGELLDHTRIAKAKRAKLALEAAAFFGNGGSRAFDQFRDGNRRLDDYAAFRAASEKGHVRKRNLGRGDYDEATKNYYAYVQWRAQVEMDDLLRDCRSKGIKFYLDLPLGVNPNGYDVWRERDNFAVGVSAGAPPDPFFTKGQNWGSPPLNPHALRQTHYRYVIDFLRFQMRHAGLLRIDHVMWLHRLYWIPKGRPASEGAYVRYPAEELYAILSLESHRHRTMLVGENLGTVPPEVNEAMARHHLRETYVLQYEARPRPKLRPPPRRSVASLNTHDMPPFEAFVRGLDIDDRFELGLIKKTHLAAEHCRRKELLAALRKTLRSKGDLLEAALRWLGESNSEIVLINLEDLWRETLPQNVPGTSSERPNWRRKFLYSVRDLRANRQVRRLLQIVADARVRPRPTGWSGRARYKRSNAHALR